MFHPELWHLMNGFLGRKEEMSPGLYRFDRATGAGALLGGKSMKTSIIITLWTILCGLSAPLLAAPFIGEEFLTDPVANGRFEQTNFATQSSFTYDATNQNLIAILDVDIDEAHYLSLPFAPVTDLDDVSFSFNFRVTDMDTRVLPTAYVGLVASNQISLHGDALRVGLSALTNGLPAFNANLVQGQDTFGGETVPLAFNVDYLAFGRYANSNRQFTVEVYQGSNFASLVGRSTLFATNMAGGTNLGFSVDRIGLQNEGGTSFDYTNGSITLVIDNIFLPARLPVNLSISTNVAVREGDIGTTNAIFTLTLSSPSVQTVRVDYLTVPLSAIAGVDFLA